jgi:hypothetical protein
MGEGLQGRERRRGGVVRLRQRHGLPVMEAERLGAAQLGQAAAAAQGFAQITGQ